MTTSKYKIIVDGDELYAGPAAADAISKWSEVDYNFRSARVEVVGMWPTIRFIGMLVWGWCKQQVRQHV